MKAMHEIETTGSPDRPVTYEGFHGRSWMSKSELEWMIERLPSTGIFLEVGTASGVTAARIADARPNLNLICIDIFADWQAPHITNGEPARPDLWRQNQRPNMHLWVGDLRSFWMIGGDYRAASILVDGDHSKESVRRDLITADLLLRNGGLLFAHDCDEPGHPEVTEAVEDFCRDHGYECVEQHWTLRALRRV